MNSCMNFRALVALLLMLAPARLSSQSFLVPNWLRQRFNPRTTEVHEVQGLAEHIIDGKLRLHLRDFLELVLKNSTDVNLTRVNVFTAADQIIGAQAVYDPTLSLGFNTLRSIAPQSTQISGADTLSTLTQNSFLNYQQILPTGQTVNAGFAASRYSTNSAFNFLNPNINGVMNFSATQSLLQNRNNILRNAPVEIARVQLVVTSSQSEAHITDLVAAAAGQYWDAVRARDNIAVEQQAVDLAQKSYERDKKALDLGALASLDIFQSQTQVAERRRDLIAAQYAYREALDGLRRLIGADLTVELRSAELALEDDASELPDQASILPFEEALAAALRVRPELDAAHRRITVDDLNSRVARNLLLPRVDLTMQASASGLGGNQVALVGPLGITRPPLQPGSAAPWDKCGRSIIRVTEEACRSRCRFTARRPNPSWPIHW
jgi:outer membrane protein TolC